MASRFFATHLVLQVATISTGLLFTNLLSVEEFAVYTFATSILITFNYFTDLGSSSALMHSFHQSVRGVGAYAEMASAVLALRRTLFFISGPIVVAVFVWWGWRQSQAPGAIAALTVLVLLTVWWQMVASTRLVDLRLRGRFAESYRAEMAGALARLTVAALVMAVGLRAAEPATATALVATLVSAWYARGAFAGASAAPASSEARRRIMRFMMPTLPGGLYFMMQGQLVVWLAASMGSLQVVASIGALGRVGLVVNAFAGLTQVLFLPRLAGIDDDRLYRRRFVQFGIILGGVALVMLAAATLFPAAFLFLLGPTYQGLAYELRLVVLGAGLSLLGGYVTAVAIARSWNRWQPFLLGIFVATQVALLATLSVDTTQGALLFGVASATAGLILQLVVVAVGFARPAWVTW